ncbi:MAG: hypothetical protein QXG65_01115 [Thermoplasmata archaeon]
MADDGPSESARWEVELHRLREELGAMRAEQKELARTVAQLVQTFQALAAQMGLMTEPYGKRSGATSADRDLPGFA